MLSAKISIIVLVYREETIGEEGGITMLSILRKTKVNLSAVTHSKLL
jgi:hypothetical protein